MRRRSEIAEADAVTIVDRTDEGPAKHGLKALTEAIEATGHAVRTVDHWTAADRDVVLAVGTTETGPVGRLLPADLPAGPEGVVYRWRETEDGLALVAAGTDDRGLMYALLELADRVRSDGVRALAAVTATTETPDNEVRGVDRFVDGPVHDDWFYDEDFWTYYLDRLARCRFNRFVLVTGYDTAFMSPPYPFFVDVPGFPDVRLSGDVDASREEHRAQLTRIGDLCRERGLEFIFGVWQQQSTWRDDIGEAVVGLPDDEGDLADYCAAGLYELLVAVPEIDTLQLRVNYESGVGTRDTAAAFWGRLVDAAADAADARGTDLDLDLRAKGLTDAMIDDAVETGLDVTVPTKFWCESTGLPYHGVRMRRGELDNLDDPNRSRRYSYADLLEEPRGYDVLYRLWVIGTNRVFVWGDPDYARRFSRASQFGDARGFEVTAPLSLRGGHYALQEEKWPLFDDPELRDYEYEDERYWAWYLVFGRMGYSTGTDPEVWKREFRARFGDVADAVEDAYAAASKVLPLLTAFNLTRHPALWTWTELDTGGALFAEHNHNPRFGDVTYASAEPSDPGLFYSVEEYVSDALASDCDGRYTPPQVAAWLSSFARETRRSLEEARPDAPDTGEYRATELDLAMLADLAEFHARKVHAATALERYRETADATELRDAHGYALAMRESWASLADRGEGSYHDDLVFGDGPASAHEGQWRDRLPEIEADVDELERLLAEEGVEPGDSLRVPDRHRPATMSVSVAVPDRCRAGEPVEVTAETGGLSGITGLTLHYRHTNQLEGEFLAVAMEERGGRYHGTVPADYLTPEWDLLVYLTATGDGDGLVSPGLFHPDHPMPYHTVRVEEGQTDP